MRFIADIAYNIAAELDSNNYFCTIAAELDSNNYFCNIAAELDSNIPSINRSPCIHDTINRSPYERVKFNPNSLFLFPGTDFTCEQITENLKKTKQSINHIFVDASI